MSQKGDFSTIKTKYNKPEDPHDRSFACETYSSGFLILLSSFALDENAVPPSILHF